MAKAQDTLDALKGQVDSTNTVMGSATTLINGFAGRMDKAVQDALANGATADQLAPITDEIAGLKANADALAAAIQANTPADPNAPPSQPLSGGAGHAGQGGRRSQP